MQVRTEVVKHQNPIDKRKERRYELDVHALLRLASGALLPARTLDISESGFAVIAMEEIELGDRVELNMKLLDMHIRIGATIRNRTGFRYGCEFLHAEPAIKRTVALLSSKPD